MNKYANYHIGQDVEIYDNDGDFVFAGIITKMGTFHACVNDYITGENNDVSYDFIYRKGIKKKSDSSAPSEIIKDEEREGKKFVLSKQTKNADGNMSVMYEITVDGKVIWESEQITTNIYDSENGWSSPDDFDSNKLELIQQTAESGFDIIVESYTNMKDLVQQDIQSEPEEGGEGSGEETAPKGEPAFAPGEEPDDMSGGDVGGGGDMSLEDNEEFSEEGVEEDGGAEPFAEEPTEEPQEEVTSASVEYPSFSRSILSGKKDRRLHNNPEHRINPILRNEMERKNIDSGDTHDIELADKLKNFDYGNSK